MVLRDIPVTLARSDWPPLANRFRFGRRPQAAGSFIYYWG